MKHIFYILTLALYCIACDSNKQESIAIITEDSVSVRIKFGANRLLNALKEQGYKAAFVNKNANTEGQSVIVLGLLKEDLIQMHSSQNAIVIDKHPKQEGFVVKSKKNTMLITGTDPSGVLYGCIDLANIIREKGKLPKWLNFSDAPEMLFRGACVGMQKSAYLPSRAVYEYPYTTENFPWFYDKQMWIDYLDMLVNNKMNMLYLWNGHPFSSLVKLKDYPYALEVSEDDLKKNEEMFEFLTQEADKRGICIIQEFYNIIVPRSFAQKHRISTQNPSLAEMPLVADYTRKSIVAFITKYPNVGLLVTLGDAMRKENEVEWFVKTIIPSVKEALMTSGKVEEPPIIIRAQNIDAKNVVGASLPMYKNLYTMIPYNGEALTTYQPLGVWAQIHQDLSDLGPAHIDNVQIMSNLEPFRYGAPEFIRKSVLAMNQVHCAKGLHLYSQASYWDWPYTADNTSPRLRQIDRDWIWYKAWGRYAWNSTLSVRGEGKYWASELARKYGCKIRYGRKILTAY
ncbi:MAG: alpha-d-galacturonidase, partial [Bacteroidales bacterium]